MFLPGVKMVVYAFVCCKIKAHTSEIQTYVFGSQELHAFGHLVGKAEQVGSAEAFVCVVRQQDVHLAFWFGKHTHTHTGNTMGIRSLYIANIALAAPT